MWNGIKIDWNDMVKFFDWNDMVKLFGWNDVVKFFIHEQEEMY